MIFKRLAKASRSSVMLELSGGAGVGALIT